nr:unnamed protein product [Spirometra erinaceieuropaei]
MAASLTSPQAGDLPASCLHTLHYDSIIADACAYNRRLFKGRESRPPFFDIATQITQRPAPWLQRNSQGGLKRLSTSRSQFVLVYRRHRWRLQPRRPTSKQQTRLVDGIALDSSQLLLMFPPVSFSGNQSKSGASESTPGGRCAPKNQPLPPEPVKQPSTAILYDPEASLHGSASGDGSCLSSATQNSTSNSASSFMDRRFVGDQAFAGSKLLTDSGFVASRRTDYRCQDQQQQPSFDEQQRFRTYPSSTGGDPSQQAVSGASYYLNGDKMRLRGEQGTNTTAAITRPTTGYDSGKAKMGKKRALGERTGQKPCTKSTGDFGQAQVGRREPRSKTDNRRYEEGNRHGLALDSETLDNDSQDSCALSEEATYRSNALLPPRPPPLPPPGSPSQGSPSGLLHANMERGLAAYGSRDPRGGSLTQPPRFSEGILDNYVCHRTAASSSQKSRAPPMNGGLDSQRGNSEVGGLRGPSESDLYQMPTDATPEDHRPRSLYSGGSVAERSASDSSSFLSSLKLSTSSDLDYTRRQSPSFSHSPLTAVAPETQMKQPFSGQHFSALPDTSVSSCSSSSSCSALASMDHMASSLLQQQQQSQSSGLLTQLQSANFAKNARSGSPKEQHIGRAFTDSLSVLGTTTSASYAADTFKLMQPSKPERGGQQLGGTSPLCAQMPPEGSAVTQYQSSMPSFLADYYMTPDAFSGGGGGGGVPMCHQRPPPTYGPGAAVGRSSFLEFRNMMRQRRQLQYPPLTDMFVSCGYCQMRVEPSDPDSYARCFSCGVTVHTVCALRFRGPQPRRGSGINPLQCYPWLCVECKTCWICGSGLNETLI